jgi:hypothetical protein
MNTLKTLSQNLILELSSFKSVLFIIVNIMNHIHSSYLCQQNAKSLINIVHPQEKGLH